MELDRTFPHDYECECDVDLPGGGKDVFRYPTSGGGGSGGGVVMRVTPVLRPAWFGLFAPGQVAARALTGLFTTPSAAHLCAVSKGDAYRVSVEDPASWERLSPDPVMEVRAFRDPDLLLLADPWRVEAIGAEGTVWRTGRLAMEGLHLCGRAGPAVRVLVEDGEEQVELHLDLQTGRCIGPPGWSPPAVV